MPDISELSSGLIQSAFMRVRGTCGPAEARGRGTDRALGGGCRSIEWRMSRNPIVSNGFAGVVVQRVGV